MEATMNIIEFRMLASNNYTLINEQDMCVGTYAPTRTNMAVALDEAVAEAIERRGYSGMGAGARIVAVVADPDDPDDQIEIPVDDLPDSVVYSLESGSLWHLYRHAARLRRELYWNGHNHIHVEPTHVAELIDEIKNEWYKK